jgi:hypothetical protein
MKMQEALFAKIRDTLANPKDLAKTLQDVLHISADAAYRRLRSETTLSIDEAYKLGNHFKVSLSDLEAFKSNRVSFIKRPFIDSIEKFEFFMEESLAQLNALTNDPNHLMVYSAKDVPLFYQYKYKELGAFKIYVWMRGIYDIERINNEYYTVSKIPERLLTLAQKQWEAYSRINVIEVWNDTTITSSLNQIQYYYEAGMLESKQEALLLCDQMEDMLKLIYKQTRYGKRVYANGEPSTVDYKLYFHEVLIMDNHIVSKINNRLTFNIPYAAVNFLSTTNTEFADEMFTYILRQARKSSCLTDVSEKDRNKFFLRLRNRVDEVRFRIQNSEPFM